MKFEKSDEIYYDFLGSNFYLSLKIFDTAIQKKFILDRNNKKMKNITIYFTITIILMMQLPLMKKL